MFEIDESTEHGKRAMERLESDQVVWFTTVRKDGTPQPVPVWFLWTGEQFLIYSRPENQKLANIQQNERVALSFNSDDGGGDIAVFFGDAAIDGDAPPANQMKEYVDKYGEAIKSIGMTPESFAEEYSVPIRVKPTYVHGH